MNAGSTLSTLSGGSVAIGGTLFTDTTSQIDVGNSTSVAASDFFNDGANIVIRPNASGTAKFKYGLNSGDGS